MRNLNKKGFWSIIISAILVTIIVGTLLVAFNLTTWKGIKSFLGLGFDEEEITGHPLGDCQPVLCSTQALTCALNSMAINKDGWTSPLNDQYTYCPNGYDTGGTFATGNAILGFATKKIDCDIMYGEVCVVCHGQGNDYICDVKGFTLPQTIQKSFAETWVKGWGDPEFLLYYEKFPMEEASYWKTDIFSYAASTIMISAGLNFVLGVSGPDKALAKEMVEVGVEKGSKSAISHGLTKMASRSIVINSLRRISKLFSKQTVRKAATLFRLRTALTKLDDPLLKALKPSQYDTVIDDAIEGISDFVARDGTIKNVQAAKQAFASSLSTRLTKEFDKGLPLLRNIDEAAGIGRKQVTRAGAKKWVFFDRFTGSEISEQLAGSRMQKAREIIFQDFPLLNLAKEDASIEVAVLAARRAGQEWAAPQFRHSTTKKLISQTDALAQLSASSQKLLNNPAYDTLFSQYTQSLTRKQLKQVQQIMALRGTLSKLRHVTGALDDAALKLFKDGSIENLDALAKLPKGVQQGVIDQAVKNLDGLTKTEIEGFIKAASSADPAILKSIEGGVNNVIKGKDTSKIKSLFSRIYGGADWIKDNKYLLILGAGIYSTLVESTNEKERPIGKNNMYLNMPTGSVNDDINTDLAPETNNFYLAVWKDNSQLPNRLHLVSPCDADLRIEKKLMKCTLGTDLNNYFLIDYGQGPKPVEQKSIIFKSPSQAKQEIIQSNVNLPSDSYSWSKGQDIGGNIDWFYKKIKGTLYRKFKDKNTLYVFSVAKQVWRPINWDAIQFGAIFAQAKKLGTNTWHKEENIGGKSGFEYAVSQDIDNSGKFSLYAKKGTTHYKWLGGSIWKTLTDSGLIELRFFFEGDGINKDLTFPRASIIIELDTTIKNHIFYQTIDGEVYVYQKSGTRRKVNEGDIILGQQWIKDDFSTKSKFISKVQKSATGIIDANWRALIQREYFRGIYRQEIGYALSKDTKFGWRDPDHPTLTEAKFEMYKDLGKQQSPYSNLGKKLEAQIQSGKKNPDNLDVSTILNQLFTELNIQIADPTQEFNKLKQQLADTGIFLVQCKNGDLTKCKEALDIYHDITYDNREFYENTFKDHTQGLELIDQAQQSILEIYSVARPGVYEDMFEITGRLDKQTTHNAKRYRYCGYNQGIWTNDGLGCSSTNPIIDHSTFKKEKTSIKPLSFKLSMWFSGFFEQTSTEWSDTIIFPPGLKQFFVSAIDNVKNTLPHRTDLNNRNLWTDADIGLYYLYQEQDCLEIAQDMVNIPFFAWYYEMEADKLTESTFFHDCMGGLAIYPAFYEKKFKTHFYSQRPSIGGLEMFDQYAVPFFRDIENDHRYVQDTYEELMTKKNYYESKSHAMKRYDIGTMSFDDAGEWQLIATQIARRYKENIDIENLVKICKTGTDKDDFYQQLQVLIPETIYVSADKGPYNDGTRSNYCYSFPETTVSKVQKQVLMWNGLILDPIVAVSVTYFTGGNVFIARGALALKGAAEAFLIQKIDKKRSWPGTPAAKSSSKFQTP